MPDLTYAAWAVMFGAVVMAAVVVWWLADRVRAWITADESEAGR